MKKNYQWEEPDTNLTTVYLGLGSNLGDRHQNMLRAIELLQKSGIGIRQVSPIYETAPLGYKDQPLFLNAVCQGTTFSLRPDELLRVVKGIEVRLGRTPSFRNAPRIIDIDILLYGNEIITTPQLIIPHPRLRERAFVLLPLADIAPHLQHPVTQESMEEMILKVNRKGIHKV